MRITCTCIYNLKTNKKSLFHIVFTTLLLLVDGIVKFNGPFSQFLAYRIFWVIQCQISQPLLYHSLQGAFVNMCE